MRSQLTEVLRDAPVAVRRAMLDDAANLAPGAAHVMGRFWTAVQAGAGNLVMPSEEAYRAAAASESTFRCLLRALATYAPHVSTAPAKRVSDEWHARRCTSVARETNQDVKPAASSWPESWRQMKSSLDAAKIKSSEAPRVYRRVFCSKLMRRYQGRSCLHRMRPPFLAGADGRLRHVVARCCTN